MAGDPRGENGFGYDPAFMPRELEPPDERTMAELTDDEKHAISHRGRAARLLASHLGQPPAAKPSRSRPVIRTKAGAATLSVASNSVLIALKLAAGAITGSIAIITEALHSAIDLMASVVALVSVRKADEPADAEHPYGHEKVENLAAAIEGMLILVGAGVIIYEATRRLASGEPGMLDDLGVGIVVIAVSALVNTAIALFLRRKAQELSSPALAGDAAHLGTDALTSVGVLAGLALVEITGEVAFDSIAALCVAAAIVFSGLRILTRSSRVLVDEAPPAEELDRIEAVIAAQRADAPEIAGYHKLRARRSGAHLHVDLHLQFHTGHQPRAGALRRTSPARRDRGRVRALRDPDPHRARGLLPRARQLGGRPRPRGVRAGPAQSRLTAAARPTAPTVIA